MSFVNRLLRRRSPLYDVTGFAGGNLGDQLDQQPQDRSGIILGTGAGAGRGYEIIPRDPNYSDEIPQQTKRRMEMNDTWRQGRTPEDYRDPTAAQFPVNALGMSVNDGYGQGYNKSVLDRGYQPPQGFQSRLIRPRTVEQTMYQTQLSPQEEMQFQQWKQKYAPDDSGADYDLRGAFKAGLTPDSQTGHWPDTFKKPNHPTFSNQSQYATGINAARAGSWDGNRFVAPQDTRPRTVTANPQSDQADPLYNDQTGKRENIQPLPQPPSMLTPTNQAATTRPRTVMPQPTVDTMSQQPQQPSQQLPPDQQQRPRTTNPFLDRLLTQPAQVRDRRTQPRDYIADDSQYLSDIQNKPLSWRDKAGMVAQVVSRSLGGEPLPTRRQRDLARAQGQLQTDIGVEGERAKNQALKSQMDAREAAILAGQQRIQQGDEKIQAQRDALQQHTTQEHRNNLLRFYNGQTDFDPEDPANAGFITEWQKEFGFKPSKNVRGSQMAVVQGYDADGKPLVSIINKGKGTGTQATGDLPTTTDQQLNRAQRQAQFNTAEAGRNQRAMQSQAGANQRAGMRTGGVSVDRPTARRAATLVGKIESARQAMSAADARLARDPNNAQAKTEREQARQAGEAWAAELNNLNAGYEAGPGTQGYPYYKKADQQSQPQSGRGSFDLAGWKTAHPNATAEEIQAVRSKAKARNLAIIE